MYILGILSNLKHSAFAWYSLLSAREQRDKWDFQLRKTISRHNLGHLGGNVQVYTSCSVCLGPLDTLRDHPLHLDLPSSASWASLLGIPPWTTFIIFFSVTSFSFHHLRADATFGPVFSPFYCFYALWFLSFISCFNIYLYADNYPIVKYFSHGKIISTGKELLVT